MSMFGRRKWLSIEEVMDETGLTYAIVRNACKFGDIAGAFRPSLSGSSRWRIPAQGAQDWFDEMRGIKSISLTIPAGSRAVR